VNDNAKAWVAALRSTDYEQGQGQLHSQYGGDKFCCLGLACKLAVDAGVDIAVRVDPGDDSVLYDDDREYLPAKVRDWLGLQTCTGSMLNRWSLAHENDGGATFAEIADIIESEPVGLFDTDEEE
jgi:hypothetical protein